MDANRFLADLRRYWDGIARGGPATPGDFDPDLAAAIRRLHALPDVPPPDPTYANQLRESIMHASTAPIPLPVGPSLDGHSAPSIPRPWPAPIRLPQERRGWPLAEAATALLLAATLLIAYIAFFRQTEESAVIVPAIGTPTPDATPTGDWTTYRGGPARIGVSASPGPAGSPLQLWRAMTGDRVNSEPAVVDGVVYVGSEDHHLYAFDAATGEERWRFDVGAVVSSSPAVVDGVVYVGSDLGEMLAINAATGEERWRAPGARFQASPAVVAGVVYTGGEDGNLYALDAATGDEIWRLELGGIPSRSPAVGEGLVVIGADDGFVHAVDQQSGQERWRFAIADDGVIATPVIANGVVYEAAFDGAAPRLYALDAATGEELWQFATESNESIWVPAVGADTLYAGTNDGNVYAIDAATGAERWRFATGDIVPSSGTLAGDVLFAASYDRNLYALDVASGQELWRFPLDHEVDKGPAIVDGVAYVGTKAGSIYAIAGTESAAEAASSSMTAPAPAVGTTDPAAGTAALELLWQTTGGSEPLDSVGTVELDPAGNVYVLDANNNRFQIFSPGGEFMEMWDGSSGDGKPFDLHSDYMDGSDAGIAFDAAGAIFVVEAGARRVQAFDADRRFITSWGGHGTGDGQFVTPIGIALDAAGNVYVIDIQRNDVQRFAPDGTFLGVIGEPGDGPGQLSDSGHLTVDGQGNIVVADYGNNRIVTFAADGTPLAMWGSGGSEPGQFDKPADVALDTAGNVYVADLDNTRIQQFSPEGDLLAVWSAGVTPAGSPNHPYALTLDGQGHLYVAGAAADYEAESSVQKFRLPTP